MDEDLVRDAERRLEIATAKLGVAEEYRTVVGVAVGLLTHLIVGNWWIAAATFGVAFWFAASRHDKEYEAANDAFERLTGTGKYCNFDREESPDR